MKTLQSALYMLLGLGLTGCATTLQTIPADFTFGVKEESVVIGRVIIDMGVKPIAFFDSLAKIEVALERVGGPVLKETTGTTYTMVCDKSCRDSNFFLALPPGNYHVTKVVLGQLEFRPSGRFEVELGQVTYLGTLKFASAGMGTSMAASVLMGRGTVVGRWQVVDEYESSVKAFRERYPQMKQEVVKNLMQLE